MPTEVHKDFQDQSDFKLERFQIDNHDENCTQMVVTHKVREKQYNHARLQRCRKHSRRGKGLTFSIKRSKKFYEKKPRKTDCVEGSSRRKER
ncbi:hypothetical protein ALC57_13897 [Trachymyrmex cornetzi]|uniref:Uncharacterized protein n=1 Tax=Trachymyrmex cornetzi TaxID=471704 RepID=A0A195DLR9_9HYME|nr:hypothetical protein ALC57_13897 [Trachymyrmex cornetzi]